VLRRFYRSDKKYKHAGRGLAHLVAAIVKLHGFRLAIPLAGRPAGDYLSRQQQA